MRRLACVVTAAAVIACAGCGDSADDNITSSLTAKLAAMSGVKVETHDQVVTLSGTVDTPAAKEQIVNAARETEGVKDIVDNIQVKGPEGATASAKTGAGIGNSAAKAASATGDAAKGTGDVVADGAKATGNVITEGAKATGDVVVEGAKATGTAVVKGTETVAKPVGDAAKAVGTATVKGAEAVGTATVKGAEAVGTATVKGAKATASGAKKLGSGVVGAVTPDEEKK